MTKPLRAFTVREVAEQLGISTRTVWVLIQRGELKRVKVTSRVARVTERELERFIRAKGG